MWAKHQTKTPTGNGLNGTATWFGPSGTKAAQDTRSPITNAGFPSATACPAPQGATRISRSTGSEA